MARIYVTGTAVIDAPPQMVYDILRDYRVEHPRILPDQYFSNYMVERGGEGEGTLFRFQTHLLGKTRDVRAEVHEPEPGRLLSEKDLYTGAVTSFRVEPVTNGQSSSVTISTEWTRTGITGLVERLLAPALLRRVYTEELKNLNRRAKELQHES